MSEEARQSREETSNVKPSLTNLSRKCSNCGQTGHNSRTCLEARDLAISEAELKSHTADSNLTNAPHHHAEQLAERLGRDEDAEASDCSGGAYRGSKKKGGLPLANYAVPTLAFEGKNLMTSPLAFLDSASKVYMRLKHQYSTPQEYHGRRRNTSYF